MGDPADALTPGDAGGDARGDAGRDARGDHRPEGAILEARGITKRYPGVVALRAVDLHLHAGEVLAVIGENGAGKSTLMRILAGVEQPDGGQVIIHGEPRTIDSCRRATELGIALIHQELNLADNLEIGASMFLGREPIRRGLIDDRKIQLEAERFLAVVGLDISPTTVVQDVWWRVPGPAVSASMARKRGRWRGQRFPSQGYSADVERPWAR